MAKPSQSEIGQMAALSLFRYYKRNSQTFITQGRHLVAAVRNALSAINYTNQYVIDRDVLAGMIKGYLAAEPDWTRFLRKKWGLPYAKHDMITDIMARYISYSDYSSIVN
jgi:hypothetical protein